MNSQTLSSFFSNRGFNHNSKHTVLVRCWNEFSMTKKSVGWVKPNNFYQTYHSFFSNRVLIYKDPEINSGWQQGRKFAFPNYSKRDFCYSLKSIKKSAPILTLPLGEGTWAKSIKSHFWEFWKIKGALQCTLHYYANNK